MTADSVTVLRARGRRLAKLIHPDGIRDYDAAKTVDLFEVPVAGLDALAALLQHLLLRPDCCIVRGAVIDPTRTRGVRRLAYATKAGEQPTLREASRRWLALDMDGVERPEGVPAADLAACGAAAIQRLPAAFHGVRCIVQATAGHGIKPGCRVRLYYWLDRPTTGAELKRWLGAPGIDASVFRTVQPIYTAAPVFAAGLHDHLPQRIAELPGAAMVAVPPASVLAPPERRAASPMPQRGSSGADSYAFAALCRATARVASAAVNSRHATMLREARGLARFVKAGLLAESAIRSAIAGAAEQAGKSVDEADAVITWALDHPSAATLPAGVN